VTLALTFVTWVSEAEEQASRRLAGSFEQDHGVAVGNLDVVEALPAALSDLLMLVWRLDTSPT